jgi:dinuclear metal center YbgI/SA1388 family protein
VPSVRAVLDDLGRTVSWSKAAGWDPVGLQVGDLDATVDRIGVCHDVTAGVLDAADAAAVGLLIAYHPLLFDPAQRFVAGQDSAGLAFRAVRSGVAVAVVHTAFDVAAGGTADALASALDLAEVVPFGPLWGGDAVKVVTFAPSTDVDGIVAAMSRAGAGVIGDYSGCSFRSEGVGTFTAGPAANPMVGEAGATTSSREIRVEMTAPAGLVDQVVSALARAHPYDEPAYDVIERRPEAGFVGRIGSWSGTLGSLVEHVDDRLGGVIRGAGERDGRVTRVAVVPGSGASMAHLARAEGADALVTGDVKHHDARAAVGIGLGVVDPGHAATERPGVAKLYAAVAAGEVEVVDLTTVDADPWDD